MNLSAVKWLGLRRITDDSGCFKIVAIDQCTPIQNEIKLSFGSDEVPWEDFAEVKRVLDLKPLDYINKQHEPC